MVHVRNIMSKTLHTVGRNDCLKSADDLMHTKRIRHLPVLDEQGQLAGIVSQRDLFQSALVRALGFGTAAREKVLDSILVKEVMTDTVETTAPGTLLATAARLMADRKIGCLPVVDRGVLIGILTEGDFVTIVANGHG
jgi:CBS domain-containing membrane protein